MALPSIITSKYGKDLASATVGRNMASPSPSSDLAPALALPCLTACLPLNPDIACTPPPPPPSVVLLFPALPPSSRRAAVNVLPARLDLLARSFSHNTPLRPSLEATDDDVDYDGCDRRDFLIRTKRSATLPKGRQTNIFHCCFCGTGFPRLAWFLVLAWRSIALGCLGNGRNSGCGQAELVREEEKE